MALRDANLQNRWPNVSSFTKSRFVWTPLAELKTEILQKIDNLQKQQKAMETKLVEREKHKITLEKEFKELK